MIYLKCDNFILLGVGTTYLPTFLLIWIIFLGVNSNLFLVLWCSNSASSGPCYNEDNTIVIYDSWSVDKSTLGVVNYHRNAFAVKATEIMIFYHLTNWYITRWDKQWITFCCNIKQKLAPLMYLRQFDNSKSILYTYT